MNREELHKALDIFLDDKRESDSSFAPVEKDDIVQLDNIIYDILCTKWEKDCDGDLPIFCTITNRHTHYRIHPVNIPVDKRQGRYLSLLNKSVSDKLDNVISHQEDE